MTHSIRLFVLSSLLITAACASGTKPCSQAGDVSWTPPLKRTDRRCAQTRLPNGQFVNQGRYEEFNQAGELVLEGQFEKGKKTGLWIQYDGKTHPIAEKRFESGVETGTVSDSGPGFTSAVQSPSISHAQKH